MEMTYLLTELQVLGWALFATLADALAPAWPLIASAFAGGMVGLEREYANKPAGLRTNMLICVGSCLYCIMSVEMGLDPTRIAAQVVSGVGFIGAGAILRIDQHITGVTTAATIWLVAAIGMALGFGYITMGLTVAFFATLALFLLGRFELGMADVDNKDSSD
jgi:putative Mg2+ transporter-C (MgtC) family protein